MLNIETEVLDGTTYYNFEARNMQYTIYFEKDPRYVNVWTFNRILNRHGGSRVFKIGEKIPKAVKNAIELIKSEPVIAAQAAKVFK